jgi:hypothetical protein
LPRRSLAVIASRISGFGLAQIVVDAEGKIEVAGVNASQFEVQGDAAQVANLDGVSPSCCESSCFSRESGDPS